MLYRKEIDGLRAIAVLPVIFFHAGFEGFSGGYIGVDIFFVISGYLITSIIIEEKKNNKFSIINFYERRARRILPALSIVLIVSTLVAYVFMPANLLKSYSQSLVSVATFSSNVFFYLTNGYFSTTSDEKPLLHTWSLAVEEQYYVFFPLMIVLLWPLGKKTVIASIFFITILSLLLAQYLSSIQANDANFYLIFSRAWELLMGSMIAFIPRKNFPIWVNQLLSITGFAMVAYSIVFFDKETPFPSFYALIPVIGTCLIIVFANHSSIVGTLLSNKILVFIGLISYSLYLWHQPLFAFLRLKSIANPSENLFVLAIIINFCLAFLSWKYIENPFRNKTKFNKTKIFKYSAISIVFFITLGGVGHVYKGFENRFEIQNYADSIKFSPKRINCHTKGHDFLAPNEACKYFNENITWASFGDSHTVEPAYALAKRLENYKMGLVHLSFSGCSPALLFEAKKPGCTKWIKESLDYLELNSNIKSVLLGFRHSYYLFGEQLETYPDLPNVDPSIKFSDQFRASFSGDSRELYWRSFSKIVSKLLQMGKTVYILYPIPELPLNINKAVMPFSIFGNETMIKLESATSSEYYNKRHQYIISRLDALHYGGNLKKIKSFNVICDESNCPAVRDGNALYYDDNHLSIKGAELLIKSIKF